MRNINYPNAKAMVITVDEAETLRKAADILCDVGNTYGNANTIMALETGEVITPGELGRAMAILEFISTYRMVEINPQ